MNEPTFEENLYDMPQAEIDGLKERIAVLSRNMRLKGMETYRFMNYEIGEDFECGNLGIDIIDVKTRKVFGKGTVENLSRSAFLMIDREGNLMVRAKYRPLVRQLSQALILEELAAI